MENDKEVDLDAIAKQSDAIAAAVQKAVRRTLEEHKKMGDPVVFGEGGIVRWVPPEEIVIPDEPSQQ